MWPTDQPTDGPTDTARCRVACPWLKVKREWEENSEREKDKEERKKKKKRKKMKEEKEKRKRRAKKSWEAGNETRKKNQEKVIHKGLNDEDGNMMTTVRTEDWEACGTNIEEIEQLMSRRRGRIQECVSADDNNRGYSH